MTFPEHFRWETTEYKITICNTTADKVPRPVDAGTIRPAAASRQLAEPRGCVLATADRRRAHTRADRLSDSGLARTTWQTAGLVVEWGLRRDWRRRRQCPAGGTQERLTPGETGDRPYSPWRRQALQESTAGRRYELHVLGGKVYRIMSV